MARSYHMPRELAAGGPPADLPKSPILRAAMVLPAFLFLLALGLRVAWILAVPSKPVGDFAMYWEAATHLLEHGRLDDQFIYMPGYVIFLTSVQALGGGWLAAKLAGAVVGAVGAPVVYGLGKRLWNHRAAAVAGVLCAVWPGGIAVSSVTGTDIPAAVMVAAGAWALSRARPGKPFAAPIVGGLLLGLAAWVRAVALPLAPLGLVLLWAKTRSLRRALLGTALCTLAAMVVLAPWALRNHQRYGEWFFTDSHGGLTALVGAYPNSDGQFTRALNRSFETVTGIPWLAEPHREADRLAYTEAKRWTQFEPWYAVGLGVMRADKLLSNERSLLYWPLYRAGVLQANKRNFFDRWRRELETVTDVFWWFLLLSCVAAIPLALSQRKWAALGLVPMQFALAGVYVLYFSESRYHLSIAVLAFPGAGGACVFVLDELRQASRRLLKIPSRTQPLKERATAAMSITLALTLILWSRCIAWGERLQQQHRWAVHACQIERHNEFCLWQRANKPEGPSPIKGVFSGVGLMVGNRTASAQLHLDLRSGPHTLTAMVWLVGPSGASEATVPLMFEINGESALPTPLVVGQQQVPLLLRFNANAGNNRFVLGVGGMPTHDLANHILWLEDLRVVAAL